MKQTCHFVKKAALNAFIATGSFESPLKYNDNCPKNKSMIIDESDEPFRHIIISEGDFFDRIDDREKLVVSIPPDEYMVVFHGWRKPPIPYTSRVLDFLD